MIAIILAARTGSSRLPRKVMAEAAGRPLLAHLIDRMKAVRLADLLIVGTTQDPSDDPVARLAESMGVEVYRWPVGQQNVLAGFIAAAERYGADAVVRVTADCPLLHAATVDLHIARYLMGDCDHVEVGGLPDGAWCEVVSTDTLRRIAAAPDLTDEEREHVTLHARRRPFDFRLERPDTGLGLDRERWSVDFPNDLAFVTRVFETLRPGFTFGDVRRLLERQPELRDVNAGPVGPIEMELLAAFAARTAGSGFAPLRGDL